MGSEEQKMLSRVALRATRSAGATWSTAFPLVRGTRGFTTDAQTEVRQLIESDISEHDVMVYMKGSPDAPQCGFSKRPVQLLQAAGVEFAARDVLQDQDLRQGIKDFSQWQTIPQVYIKGEFVGGSDVLFEMFRSGDLDKMLDDKGVKRVQ